MKSRISPFFLWIIRHFLVRPTLWSFYKFRFEGRENLPDLKTGGPAVLVCKHQSWMDLFAVCDATGLPLYYMAKNELFENLFGDFEGTLLSKFGNLIAPLTSMGLMALGAIPLDREHPEKKLSSFKQMLQLLSENKFLTVFPEGMVKPGHIGEFKSGLINMLIKAQKRLTRPIVFIPVGISYLQKEKGKEELVVKIGKSLELGYDRTDAAEVLKEKVTELTEF